MAKKRMFRLDVLETDAFMDMPLSAQALYFHLNLRADDDGFIGNPKQIVRTIGSSEDDLRLLIAKRFLLTFDDGVIVIKHWRMHNTLSSSRYSETKYIEDKAFLKLKENNAYSFENGVSLDDKHLIETGSRQSKTSKRRDEDEQKTSKRRTIDVTKTTPDKDSIDKISIGKDSIDNKVSSLHSDTSSDKRTDYDIIADMWNELDGLGDIKGIMGITGGKRRDRTRARLKEYGLDGFRTAIDKVKESDFLQGKKKEWAITYDWFIRPSNFPKVLEGNYDNNGGSFHNDDLDNY